MWKPQRECRGLHTYKSFIFHTLLEFRNLTPPQRRVHLGRCRRAEPAAIVQLDREQPAAATEHAPATFRHPSEQRSRSRPAPHPPFGSAGRSQPATRRTGLLLINIFPVNDAAGSVLQPARGRLPTGGRLDDPAKRARAESVRAANRPAPSSARLRATPTSNLRSGPDQVRARFHHLPRPGRPGSTTKGTIVPSGRAAQGATQANPMNLVQCRRDPPPPTRGRARARSRPGTCRAGLPLSTSTCRSTSICRSLIDTNTAVRIHFDCCSNSTQLGRRG